MSLSISQTGECFGSGAIRDIFHCLGTTPDLNEELTRQQIGDANTSAKFLSNLLLILSHKLAFPSRRLAVTLRAETRYRNARRNSYGVRNPTIVHGCRYTNA